MSSFSRVARTALVALALLAPLAACTGIRPVYTDAGLGMKRVNVAYAAPANRLEQIIYQDLTLRLGKAEGSVPRVTIGARRSADGRKVTVTASLTVTAADGVVLFSGTRSQSADYKTDSQALANQQAITTAERQAALLLADTLRLQIIAALAK